MIFDVNQMLINGITAVTNATVTAVGIRRFRDGSFHGTPQKRFLLCSYGLSPVLLIIVALDLVHSVI